MAYTANNRRGFTLVEILVVLALTIVILGLVFGPVISSFNFTRQAETMVAAQDNARFALEQVSRELTDAMFVYDNTNQPITFPVINQGGSPVSVNVLYAKVDIVLPRMRGFCTNPNHDISHPGTQKEYPRHDPQYPQLDEANPNCPICGAPLELRPAQPLAQDTYVVRYFIGLANNDQPYSNGYVNRFSTGPDNQYVLYRAEFSPFDASLFPREKDTVAKRLAYDNFFYDSDPDIRAAWRKISRAIVTIEHTDLINLEFDPSDNPIVTPTVKFMPTAIYNDPLVATTEADDDPEHGAALPTVYRASYGNWTTPIEVTLTRPGVGSFKAVQPAATPPAIPPPLTLYDPGGTAILNITNYMVTMSASPYRVGEILPVGKPEVAFTVDTVKGTVDFSFPVVNIPASQALPSPLHMAVSKTASTDDINTAYDNAWTGAGADRYRTLVINDPTTPAPIANAVVVGGSERVLAPCATPGPNQGKYIRYSRVPKFLYEPGLNQYQLDTEYDDGTDTSPYGLACLSFHAGQTNQPGPGVPLPPGKDNLHVYYEVQNNRKADTLRANYVTKSLLTVIMGIRIYDPTSGKPQSVQLTNKVKLRNIAQ